MGDDATGRRELRQHLGDQDGQGADRNEQEDHGRLRAVEAPAVVVTDLNAVAEPRLGDPLAGHSAQPRLGLDADAAAADAPSRLDEHSPVAAADVDDDILRPQCRKVASLSEDDTYPATDSPTARSVALSRIAAVAGD